MSAALRLTFLLLCVMSALALSVPGAPVASGLSGLDVPSATVPAQASGDPAEAEAAASNMAGMGRPPVARRVAWGHGALAGGAGHRVCPEARAPPVASG